MSDAREVTQLVERLLQLTDGLVVRSGGTSSPDDGEFIDRIEEPMGQALQAKVEALDQQMNALQVELKRMHAESHAPGEMSARQVVGGSQER
jgi:hypothetical protein